MYSEFRKSFYAAQREYERRMTSPYDGVSSIGDRGFAAAQQEYEGKIFAPYDDLSLTEEEIDEMEDAKETAAEYAIEEYLIQKFPELSDEPYIG